MESYRHIMALADFSEMGVPIVVRAQALAGHYQASLGLLHVLQGFSAGDGLTGLDAYEAARQQQLGAARGQMRALADRVGLPPGVALEIREGPTSATIVEAAKKGDASLLVVGHSGKRGFLGFMGSTADHVVKSAHCDVLVVRAV